VALLLWTVSLSGETVGKLVSYIGLTKLLLKVSFGLGSGIVADGNLPSMSIGISAFDVHWHISNYGRIDANA